MPREIKARQAEYGENFSDEEALIISSIQVNDQRESIQLRNDRRRVISRSRGRAITQDGAKADKDKNLVHKLKNQKSHRVNSYKGAWSWITTLITCLVPNCLLGLFGMKNPQVQAAWREKVSLCMIIIFFCLVLAFITYGLTTLVCIPPKKAVYRMSMVIEANDQVKKKQRWFIIHGKIYNILDIYKPYRHKGFDPYKLFATHDISPVFPMDSYACDEVTSSLNGGRPYKLACKIPGSNAPSHCHQPDLVKDLEYVADLALDWLDIERSDEIDGIKGPTKFAYNGQVYDVAQYLAQVGKGRRQPYGTRVDHLLRRAVGGDATKAFAGLSPNIIQCLTDQYRAGYLEVMTIGCIATQIILYVSLVVILTVVLTKFFLAVGFAFSMARRLGKIPHGYSTTKKQKPEESKSINNTNSNFILQDSTNSDSHMYAILLVTCYSEGYDGIRTTLDSLATTDYDDKQKLLFVVADGIITGSGNDRSTPEILISMLDGFKEEETSINNNLDNSADILEDDATSTRKAKKKTLITTWDGCELFEPYYFDTQGQPIAHSYVAIADGEKRHNMARVYAGYYRCDVVSKKKKESKLNWLCKSCTNDEESIMTVTHRVPIIIVVKCGTLQEVGKPKPGNRGKRDSQIIIMSFLSKCLFDDRMSPLEYDLFYKITRLTGVTPDHYELMLMVDADTRVMPSALRSLILAMRSDTSIMGLCGETQIQNKTASWVTAIQVFEYYISHHLNKAFESIFGGVTCLPGCFCMYRIKAPSILTLPRNSSSVIKDKKINHGYWIPILASPDIVDLYSENVTDTLHKKNLLLLGEDRYLTTLMLKTFPKRKLLFVPQAVCKTFVPETFAVLLSQRRRWINSTIHNLFELVLVSDLCGIFCCSMQFVIFMELAGTLVLPAAITFTGVLIVSTFVSTPQWIPLFLLAAILGLPALLILFTTCDPTYIFWFFIYILSLPIWNFVLPVYAFWHFDDFSWGDTRKLEGSASSRGIERHGHASEGVFDESQIKMRKWEEYEYDRRMQLARYLQALHGLVGSHSRLIESDQQNSNMLLMDLLRSDPISITKSSSTPRKTLEELTRNS